MSFFIELTVFPFPTIPISLITAAVHSASLICFLLFPPFLYYYLVDDHDTFSVSFPSLSFPVSSHQYPLLLILPDIKKTRTKQTSFLWIYFLSGAIFFFFFFPMSCHTWLAGLGGWTGPEGNLVWMKKDERNGWRDVEVMSGFD